MSFSEENRNSVWDRWDEKVRGNCPDVHMRIFHEKRELFEASTCLLQDVSLSLVVAHRRLLCRDEWALGRDWVNDKKRANKGRISKIEKYNLPTMPKVSFLFF